MKNITIKFAIWYISTFDKSRFLYLSLKSLNVYLRYLFYFGVTFSLWQITGIVANHIYLENYAYLTPFITNILILIGVVFKFILIIMMFSIVSYEALFSNDIDVQKYIYESKLSLQKIKEDKLDWWRLKNRGIFTRVLIYLSIWALLFHILQFFMFSILFQNENLNKDIYVAFLLDLTVATIYMTIIYFIFILILDYFVRKNRKNRTSK